MEMAATRQGSKKYYFTTLLGIKILIQKRKRAPWRSGHCTCIYLHICIHICMHSYIRRYTVEIPPSAPLVVWRQKYTYWILHRTTVLLTSYRSKHLYVPHITSPPRPFPSIPFYFPLFLADYSPPTKPQVGRKEKGDRTQETDREGIDARDLLGKNLISNQIFI
jgi:hypothetical protein